MRSLACKRRHVHVDGMEFYGKTRDALRMDYYWAQPPPACRPPPIVHLRTHRCKGPSGTNFEGTQRRRNSTVCTGRCIALQKCRRGIRMGRTVLPEVGCSERRRSGILDQGVRCKGHEWGKRGQGQQREKRGDHTPQLSLPLSPFPPSPAPSLPPRPSALF